VIFQDLPHLLYSKKGGDYGKKMVDDQQTIR